MTTQVRRLVTTQTESGKSVFASIGPAPRADWYKHTPGMGITLVWTTPAGATLPSSGEDLTPGATSFVQEPGNVGLVYVFWPPAQSTADPKFDAAAAAEEFKRMNPDIDINGGAGGMHATDAIDYAIVLEGEITIVLDDGREELLRQHDVIIQNGTRHAWRNTSDKPAKVACFSVGARRVSQASGK